MRRLVLLLALVALSAPVAAQRPVIGIGFAGGTMGVGVDVAAQLHPKVAVRGRFAVMPYEPEFDLDDVTYAFQLPSPQMGLFADVTVIPIRLTVGMRYLANDLSATATIPSTITIGDETYTSSEVTALNAALVTRTLSPYIGIGFGRVSGRGIGLFFDAGVAMHGSPQVEFTATGPVANQPAFITELNREAATVNDDIEGFKYYPVIALGLRYGF
jgi:hypothetical protein